MHFDLKLWAMTAGMRGRIALSAGLGLLALAVGIARFAFLGTFLAGVFRHDPSVYPLLGAAAAILLRAWLDHTRVVIANGTATRVQEALRGRLFDKIVALGPAWFGAERTGGVMLSMVDGVEQLQSFFGQYLPQVTIAICAPFAIFAFIAWWDVPVAAVMLAAAVFTLILPASVHSRTGKASRTRQSAFKSFGEEFLDGVQGLPTLKAFGQSAAYGRKLAEKARALSDSTFWVLALNVLTRGFTDLGTAVGSAAALALGAYRVAHGEMSIEALLIVLMAGTEIFRPLRDLRGVLHQGLNGQAAASGINALLDTPVPVLTGAQTAVTPDIAFENVAFAYPGGRRPAHAGLSFRIAAGERVGVVGPQRLRQVDDRAPAGAALRAVRRGDPHRRDRSAVARSGASARHDRGRFAGFLPLPRHRRRQPAARLSGCERRAGDLGCAGGERARVHRRAARRLPHDDR